MLRSNAPNSRPRASSISLSRESGTRGCCTSTLSSANSPVVSATSSPFFVRLRVARFEPELAELDDLRVGARRARRRGRRAAPQHRLDARDELARIERLREVVVGADFEPDDAVDVVAFRGEHDDRHVFVAAAQPPADRKPVLARQHEVEDHQVVALARELAVHLGRVRRPRARCSPARRGSGSADRAAARRRPRRAPWSCVSDMAAILSACRGRFQPFVTLYCPGRARNKMLQKTADPACAARSNRHRITTQAKHER